MKKIYKSKFGKIVIIPLFLLSLWLFLTLVNIITFDTSFSIWSFNHSSSSFSKISYEKLKEGDKIVGEFTAKDKNLGIVALRFQTYIKPPYLLEDEVLFRIKEKGSSAWYYENIYRNGLIYEVPFFPFGFPQISDSKNKTYQFELISTKGNDKNSVSVSNRFPTLVSKYKYSREELISDKKLLVNFLIIKIYNSMLNPDIWFSSLIYLLPLLFYLIYESWKYIQPKIKSRLKIINKKISSSQHYRKFLPLLGFLHSIFVSNLYFILIIFILIDILKIQLRNDFVYLVIAYLWYMGIKFKHGNINLTLKVAIFLLILASISNVLNYFPVSEKSGVWSFIFLVVWAVQLIKENSGLLNKNTS